MLDLLFIDLLRRLIALEGHQNDPYSDTPKHQAKEPGEKNRAQFRLPGKGLTQGVSDEEEADPTERKHEQYQGNQAPPLG